jgi:hypothetical protein
MAFGFLVLVAAISGNNPLRVDDTAVAADRPSKRTQLTPVSDEEDTVSAVFSSHPQPMLANVSDEYQVARLWPRSDALAAARDALEQQCEGVALHETPLREFVTTIADKAGVRISLDREELENMGFDTDTPITATLNGLSFRAGLREVLEDVDLAYVFKNDHVVVTSVEKAARTRETVFYPVMAGVDVTEVAMLVEETVSPDSWSHRGGPGTIVAAPAGLGNGLVISHNSAVQEEIEAVLRNLDAALWTPVDQDEGVTAGFLRTYVVDDDDTRAGLEEQLLALCNDSLPHGADADARVSVIGKSIVVQSRSRPFQVMAAQIIAAIVGDEIDVEIESDEAAHASVSDSDT